LGKGSHSLLWNLSERRIEENVLENQRVSREKVKKQNLSV